VNTAALLQKQAELHPNKTAIVFQNDKISFKELDETINRFAHYFQKRGIERGAKVLLFVKPSIELPAITFALFKLGAVPVFIDPGIGLRNLLKAIAEVSPAALVSVPLMRGLSMGFRKAFKSINVRLDSTKLREQSRDQSPHFDLYDAPEDELAAILFTSGATGRAKGVVYTHKIFIAQTRLLQEMYSLTSDDVDCPYFALFSFFTLAMGLTLHVPDVDPSKPSKIDPSVVVANIRDNKATFAAGSPAIWQRVGDYCLRNNIQLPALRSLVMFGAPVAVDMHQTWQRILPNGTTYTPYGATESLPISNISGEYILENTAALTFKGAGVCVGKAVPSVEVMIHDGDEILVSGNTTTTEYYNETSATAESKLTLGGRLWHKVGDVGTIDEEGRIWFWGRKAHVVELDEPAGQKMYPVPCETVFNQHPKIKRTALVGPRLGGGSGGSGSGGSGSGGKVTPTLVIELKDGTTAMTDDLLAELKEIRDSYEHTKPIEKFILKKSFPVDVRHNIKIDNLALRSWVEEKAG